MRHIRLLLLSVSMWGQQPPPDPAAAPAAPAAPATPPADPATPPSDRWLTGSVDVGYRWRLGPGGNENVYRSIVDLGEGPKLLNADFLIDSKQRWFDRIGVRAANWGDDPYTTLNVTVRKTRIYDFAASYRNLAYFNNLPSFANPLLDQGILASERSFDMRNRMSSFDLNLFPGTWLVPYLAYSRASGYGNNVTTFVANQNEYPVSARSNYSQDNLRGGVRFEMNRYHATVEQGGTLFRDDQQLFESPATKNPGNRQTPYLGTPLYLNGLSQAYGVRGDGIYTKVMGTGQPTAWLALSGEYLYARPRNETNYQQFDTGSFISPQLLAFTSQQYLLSSAARVPHHSGRAGAEIRLHRRVRLTTEWLTDRVTISGDAAGQNTLAGSSTTRTLNAAVTELRNEYNHTEANLFWDLTARLTLRGGYRYQWGDTSNIVLPPAGLASRDAAEMRRHAGLAGFAYRLTTKASLTGTWEGAGTDAIYFRTSLNQYQKGRVQGSYQATSQLTFSGAFSALDNQNPASNIDLDYRSLQSSASILWNPLSDKRLGFQGTYVRSTIRSSIDILIPQTLQPEKSIYKDNAHTIQALCDVAFPMLGQQARLSFGGNFFLSSGSRPTDYLQPTGNLVVPIAHDVAWISEWTYHGYGEPLYAYEGFRAHLITTGIRITR